MLFNMFKIFFNYSMTPSVWLKSTITPIPRSVTKDPQIPLHYRGISLLSCYFSICNKRIVLYCEELNIFADVLITYFLSFQIYIIEWHQLFLTYTCFIDMQKAFNRVDCDLLFYKYSKIT